MYVHIQLFDCIHDRSMKSNSKLFLSFRVYSSSQQKKPSVPGERDWNDSYVYQMIHSSQKTTSSSRQDGTGQPPKGETVSTSRVTHETKYPGQEPQRRVTETIERGGVPDYKFDNAIGMSDF